MVLSALAYLDKEGGSSIESISDFLQRWFKVILGPNHFAEVYQNLERMTNIGVVELNNELYKFRPIRTMDDARALLELVRSSQSSFPFFPAAGFMNQNAVGFVNENQ